MKRILILPVFALLTACQPSEAEPPHMERVARDDFHNDVSKICDHGRAIYVTDAASGRDQMAVIDNAPECASTRPQ